MKLYDAFPTKAVAEKSANDLRKDKMAPQFVRVKKLGSGRLKYGVYVGGKNSSMFAWNPYFFFLLNILLKMLLHL